MFDDDYRNDPNFYLTLAGACSVCVCCLVCTAKNWDDPPDWVPKCCQPKWKREYFYEDDAVKEYVPKETFRNISLNSGDPLV